MTEITLDMQIKPFILLILLMCFISLNIIYRKTNENIGNKREVTAFKGMLVSFMVYSLVDIRLLIGDVFYTSLPRPVLFFIMSTGFASMSFACFFWFMHVYATLPASSKVFKIKSFSFWNIAINIPLLIVLIILYTPLRSIVYIVDGAIPLFGFGMPFILLMDYVYLISATVISIHNRRLAKTKPEKRKYSSQILFILFFTVSGWLIAFLLNLPAIELCVMPVVLKLFVELQDSQIYTDALTKLYNRRRMTEFITEEIATCNEDNPLTVIMVDLDYFKSINDILGHDEGDKALIVFSKAMQKILFSKNAVAARWGGDEFVVAGKEKDLQLHFREWLQAELDNNKSLNYMPIFSTGFFICTTQNMSCEQAVASADSALYADKAERHKTEKDFIDKLIQLKNRP